MFAGSFVQPVDNSMQIMNTLFAPFPEAAFPKRLNVPWLVTLLDAPLAAQVPVGYSTYQSVYQLYPDLFSLETDFSAPRVAPSLVTAVLMEWPTGPATELLYTPFWDFVGYNFPEVFGRRLQLSISESR